METETIDNDSGLHPIRGYMSSIRDTLDRTSSLIAYCSFGPEELANEFSIPVSDAFLLNQAALLREGYLSKDVG